MGWVDQASGRNCASPERLEAVVDRKSLPRLTFAYFVLPRAQLAWIVKNDRMSNPAVSPPSSTRPRPAGPSRPIASVRKR